MLKPQSSSLEPCAQAQSAYSPLFRATVTIEEIAQLSNANGLSNFLRIGEEFREIHSGTPAKGCPIKSRVGKFKRGRFNEGRSSPRVYPELNQYLGSPTRIPIARFWGVGFIRQLDWAR